MKGLNIRNQTPLNRSRTPNKLGIRSAQGNESEGKRFFPIKKAPRRNAVIAPLCSGCQGKGPRPHLSISLLHFSSSPSDIASPPLAFCPSALPLSPASPRRGRRRRSERPRRLGISFALLPVPRGRGRGARRLSVGVGVFYRWFRFRHRISFLSQRSLRGNFSSCWPRGFLAFTNCDYYYYFSLVAGWHSGTAILTFVGNKLVLPSSGAVFRRGARFVWPSSFVFFVVSPPVVCRIRLPLESLQDRSVLSSIRVVGEPF